VLRAQLNHSCCVDPTGFAVMVRLEHVQLVNNLAKKEMLVHLMAMNLIMARTIMYCRIAVFLHHLDSCIDTIDYVHIVLYL
jgi:hypothetical protein